MCRFSKTNSSSRQAARSLSPSPLRRRRRHRCSAAVPERISISVSGNIIKNVHSVTVPNTGGQHGVKTAVAAGIAAGDADKGLDVLSGNQRRRARLHGPLSGRTRDLSRICRHERAFLHRRARVWRQRRVGARRHGENHTNVVLVERDGEILQDTRTDDPSDGENALTEAPQRCRHHRIRRHC